MMQFIKALSGTTLATPTEVTFSEESAIVLWGEGNYVEKDVTIDISLISPDLDNDGNVQADSAKVAAKDAEEAAELAFALATDELFGEDPKGIATGTAPWMKCVRYNNIGRMDQACKDAIVTAYGL